MKKVSVLAMAATLFAVFGIASATAAPLHHKPHSHHMHMHHDQAH
ncbi:hypothetical protein [Burkholderia ubonensis]|nr:hypothetical protein [Burkholderia ubonensis]